MAKPLKIGVRIRSRTLSRVVIAAAGIALDLDTNAPQGPSIGVQDTSGEMGDLALGHSLHPFDADQIIVLISRRAQRIERPFGLARSR